MRHLAGGAGQPGGTQVLDRGDLFELVELEAGLTKQLLQERIADLHRRAPSMGPLVQLHRGKGRAVDTVTSGVGTYQQQDVARTVGTRRPNPVAPDQADAHRVHDRVVGISIVEVDFAADRRASKTVAVAANPGHHALEEVSIAPAVGYAEAQRIQDGNRTRPHCEYVPEDAADSGRRPLVGLDRRWVIV